MGFVEPHPHTLTADPFCRGSAPSVFFSRTIPSSEMSLPSPSTWAFEASVRAPFPEARSRTVRKPPYIIDTTATTTATKAATHTVDRVSLRAGRFILMTAMETTTASASATPMTIKGILIVSTIFHTSSQLMESMSGVPLSDSTALWQEMGSASSSRPRPGGVTVDVDQRPGDRVPKPSTTH